MFTTVPRPRLLLAV